MQIEPRNQKIKLEELSAKINQHFHESIRLGSEAVSSGRAAVISAVETGKLLIRAKSIIGHGKWMKWLADECADISDSTAQNWMRIASNTKIIGNLEGLKSLTQAYQTVGILPEKTPSKRELGTGSVEILDLFVSGFKKRSLWVTQQVSQLDASTLTPARKDELLAAIDEMIQIREALV